MEKNELKALDVINITEEQWEFIEDLVKKIETAETAMGIFAQKIQNYKKNMWDLVHKYYPDLESYEALMNIKKKRILVLNKKEENG